MQKIPTIFVRDDNERRFVSTDPHPACEWVFRGEGIPTRKYDGTCVMYDGTAWWARREIKTGRSAPAGFVLVATDPVTGKSVGWEPVEQSGFAKFHAEALTAGGPDWRPGTYELVGPRINRNPERSTTHRLVEHASAERLDLRERTFDAIRAATLKAYAEDGSEGIVFHAADGRMAKIKARDFRPDPTAR
ncbi:hypothetical protein [Krasilnikovia sp. MM14-A1259]|uniref:hypothetical protein n=1 Tax=Krasilnikovia sp. MM14-A1259 TaxID=3373539 RepID=UPI00399C9208